MNDDPKLSREETAWELLKCAVSHEPGARLVGNVRAAEIAALAASIVEQCPACGSEAWVNIDCTLCAVAADLVRAQREVVS